MSLPSGPLPTYVSLNRQSLWHVSALLSTSLESITLPSRLKVQHGVQIPLDELAGALNVNGNQNIAKLQMSVGPNPQPQAQTNGHDRSGRLEVRARNRDPRVPSRDGLGDELNVIDDTPSGLDIDLFPADEPNQGRVRRLSGRAHIFGKAEVFRSDENGFGDSRVEGEECVDGRERARRRATGQTVVHRLVCTRPNSHVSRYPRPNSRITFIELHYYAFGATVVIFAGPDDSVWRSY
jgi:hypothetical protein